MSALYEIIQAQEPHLRIDVADDVIYFPPDVVSVEQIVAFLDTLPRGISYPDGVILHYTSIEAMVESFHALFHYIRHYFRKLTGGQPILNLRFGQLNAIGIEPSLIWVDAENVNALNRSALCLVLNGLKSIADRYIWHSLAIEGVSLDRRRIVLDGSHNALDFETISIVVCVGRKDLDVLVDLVLGYCTDCDTIELGHYDEEANGHRDEFLNCDKLIVADSANVRCMNLYIGCPELNPLTLRFIQWLFPKLDMIGFLISNAKCMSDDSNGFQAIPAAAFFDAISRLCTSTKRIRELSLDVSPYTMNVLWAGLLMRLLVEFKCYRWVRLVLDVSTGGPNVNRAGAVNEWMQTLVELEGHTPAKLRRAPHLHDQFANLNKTLKTNDMMPYGPCIHPDTDGPKQPHLESHEAYYENMHKRARFFGVSMQEYLKVPGGADIPNPRYQVTATSNEICEYSDYDHLLVTSILGE